MNIFSKILKAEKDQCFGKRKLTKLSIQKLEGTPNKNKESKQKK